MKKVAQPTSRIKLRALARKTRSLADAAEDQPFPVVKFLEKVMLWLDYEMDIVPDSEMEENYAETIPSLRIFRIRESVYENAIRGYHRDRFTIAHEIAHLLFHDDITVTYARNEKTIPAYMDPEWQANTFAAELLVPHTQISEMSAEEISKKYGVSKKVAQIQASYASKVPA